MSTDAYIGMGLALLGSNMCLVLLLLNALGWIDFLHADLTAIENFAEKTLSRWQPHFQTATAAWLVFTFISAILSARDAKENGGGERARGRRPTRRTALVAAGVSATLALPHAMLPYRNVHPVVRRSLVGGAASASTNTKEIGTVTANEPAAVRQELVFSVDQMTCGGCGSHVRNLAESALSAQQKSSSSSFAIDKVEVDWRAGVMSIYGTGLVDSVDREAVAAVLGEDGYPTSFLYSQ